MNAFIRTVASSLLLTTALLFSGSAQALLPTHECGYCHSLHGSDTGFVPRTDQINMEVLCMGCHLTANGATAAVQPHRDDGGYPAHYVTCTDCHEVHDNMPNWRLNDPNHAADDDAAGRNGTDVRPLGWPVGYNTEMVGREDPDGETPYAIIITKERDMNKDGVPDRNTVVTPACNETVLNDCYVTRKRHVIFENRDASDTSTVTIHGWADHDEDNMQPSDASAWSETLPDLGDTGTNGGAPHDAICHMCHTVTSKNACGYDGAADCTLHNQARTCTDCHLHDGCFDKGSQCEPWTLPNRDVRMDTVSAAPTSVNSGQTVTITADFTNLGDAAEEVRVKFYSSIDQYLGFIDVSGVAPGGGTGQANFDWVTTTDGDHTISAEAQPVLAEVNVANNTATFGTPVTVANVNIHDIAVTSVSSPSPVQQGNTETVSVGLENLGNFTEGPFDVTLTSDLDGLIDTVSSGTLTPGATPTLNFSWNTAGATLGTHTLTATFATFDDVPGNDSANTTAVVAIHDVAVTNVTAPPSTDQGTIANVNVDLANNSGTGGFSETFNVTLYDNTDDPGHASPIGTQSSGLLAPQGTTQLTFNWDTTGASIATHTLEAIAATVAGETITGNNTNSTTADVIAPVTHDVQVVSVTAPATVDRGNSPTVSVVVKNNGGAVETFNVTLSSDLDGQIQVLSSGALGIGAQTTLNFTWATVPATSLGVHTLTAVADTVAGETNTADNTNTTTSTVTSHDLAVTSVTDTPDPVSQGGTVTIDVTVTNQGSFAETFDVTLTSDQDGLIHTWTNVNLNAGATTTPALTYNWDTTGATVTTHTLTVTAGPVSGELDTADNSATTTSEVTSGVVHDVAAISVTPSPSVVKLKAQTTDVNIAMVVENLGSTPETFNVNLYDTTDDPGHTSAICTETATNLATGQTTLNCVWSVNNGMGLSIGVHTLTAVADTVSGEVITANNSVTGTIEFK
jgi:predicted CXXCH cytochrome family protein